MKKRKLEMILEPLEGFSNPNPKMEQYKTPATVAAELLHWAFLRGDLLDVCDLGCGTGMLSIGAALLGAKSVGIELDPAAIKVARKNADQLGVYVDFILGDVNSIALKKISTVIMNPPFGAQRRSSGDRAFLKRATEIGDVVYSIHNAGSEEFIKRFVKPCEVDEVRKMAFPMKRCFQFHSKDVKVIEVELYRIVCK